jgi:hypothetical protein
MRSPPGVARLGERYEVLATDPDSAADVQGGQCPVVNPVFQHTQVAHPRSPRPPISLVRCAFQRAYRRA